MDINIVRKKLLDKNQTEYLCKNDFLINREINGIEYEINLMNLTSKNNRTQKIEMLWKDLFTPLYDITKKGKDYNKTFREYCSLNRYLESKTEIMFKKSDRPDFYIKDNRVLYGLEITSAVTNEKVQTDLISRNCFGRNLPPSDIEKYIDKRHKNINKEKIFINSGGTSALVSSSSLEKLAELILASIKNKNMKIKKYNIIEKVQLLIDLEGNQYFKNCNEIKKILKIVTKEDRTNINKTFIINQIGNEIIRVEL